MHPGRDEVRLDLVAVSLNKSQVHHTGGTSAICESLSAQGISAIRPDPSGNNGVNCRHFNSYYFCFPQVILRRGSGTKDAPVKITGAAFKVRCQVEITDPEW